MLGLFEQAVGFLAGGMRALNKLAYLALYGGIRFPHDVVFDKLAA